MYPCDVNRVTYSNASRVKTAFLIRAELSNNSLLFYPLFLLETFFKSGFGTERYCVRSEVNCGYVLLV